MANAGRRTRSYMFTKQLEGRIDDRKQVEKYSKKNIAKGFYASLAIEVGEIDFMVFQLEAGHDTGKLHYQGWVKFKHPKRITTLINIPRIMNIGGCHWEIKHGTDEQAWNYCTKQDTKVAGHWLFPENLDENALLARIKRENQGKRSDLHALVNSVLGGDSVRQTFDLNPNSFIRYNKNIYRVAQMLYKPRPRTPYPVILIHGKSGVGKSKAVWYAHDNICDHIYKKPAGKWFDGYTTQEILYFEDFNWRHKDIEIQDILHMFDCYPDRREDKGGFVWSRWKMVIITDNATIDQWFHMPLGEHLQALDRRITHRCEMVREGDETREIWHKGEADDWERLIGDICGEEQEGEGEQEEKNEV